MVISKQCTTILKSNSDEAMKDGMRRGYYGNIVMISSQTTSVEVYEDSKA